MPHGKHRRMAARRKAMAGTRMARIPRPVGTGEKTTRYVTRYVSNLSTTATTALVWSVSDNPSSAPEWTQLTPLYQLYRVTAIGLEYVPRFTQKEFTTAATPFNVPQYVVHDTINQLPSAPTENDLIQFQKFKVFDILNHWKAYFKMNKRLNHVSITVSSTDGFISTAAPIATQQLVGFVPIMGGARDIGRLIVTLYIDFRVRR